MKNLLLYAFFFNINVTALRACDSFAVILMIKNEEAAMQPTLQPFIDAGINSYLILDTGSTDNTIKATQDLFTTHTITQGYIMEQPFIDFATSRNYALQCAKEKFPDTPFFLMIDAEWIMENVQGFISFCKANQESIDSYLVCIDNNASTFFVPRLINARQDHFFVGTRHEQLNCLPDKKVPNTIFFKLQPSPYDRKKSHERWQKDVSILLKELQSNPEDTRTLFYLAQTYHGLEDFENACIYYKKRLSTLSFDFEESFMAAYNLGLIYHYQLKTWPQALYYYLFAFDIRPIRAEPLYQIALYYYEQKEYNTCYWFALHATQIPFPANESHPVFKEIYTYHRYNLLGAVAWFTKNYDIGEAAVRQALFAKPNMPHLLINLNAYLSKNN